MDLGRPFCFVNLMYFSACMNRRSNRVYQFIFVLAIFIVWPYLRTYVNNPDSFQYIRLARYWYEGKWSEAVNGYWSPAISWLLSLMLLSGKHPVLLFKFLQALIALSSFTCWCRLVDRVGSFPWMKLIAIPLFISQAFLTLTPDLLFVTVNLALIDYFIQKPVWNDSKRSLVAGIIGGISYLSKAFGFPLFMVVVIISYLHHRNTTSGSSFKNMLIGVSAFAVISATWIIPISIKYGYFTLSEAAAFNSTREVSGQENQIVHLPILYEEGLIVPYGNSALSAWEEPMQSKPMKKLDPLNSKADRQTRLDNLKRNFLSMWYFDFRRQPGMIFILLMVLAFISFRGRFMNDVRFFYPLMLMLSVYIGYGLILYHARYSWICTYMMILISGLLYQNSSKGILRNLMKALVFVMAILVVKRPVKEILFSHDQETGIGQLWHAVLQPRATLTATYSDDELVFNAGENIRCIDGPFVSRFDLSNGRPRYFSSLLLAERSVQRYCGQIDDLKADAIARLQNAGIKYFVVWKDDSAPAFSATPICRSEGVVVYRIP